MSWLCRYHSKLYLRNSIWVLPLISIGAGLVAVQLLSRIERALGWQVNISIESRGSECEEPWHWLAQLR